MKKRLVLAVSSIAMLLVMFVAGCGTTATGNKTSSTTLPRVVIMVGGIEKQIYLPFELTQQLGYFKDEGVNVVLMTEAAGQDAEVATLSGQVDGAGGFYDHCIDLQTKGKYLESVVQMAQSPGERLMIANRIKDQVKTVADLKGKKIGITDLGSSTNFLASYNVVKGGNPVDSYTPVPVGAGDTLIAAMKAGQIDLAVTTEPTVSRLEDMGLASVFVDMNSQAGVQQNLGGAYPATCLYMRTEYVQAHPEVVQKLVNAFVRTMDWMSKHTPEEIAAKMPEAYFVGDKAMYVKALKGTLPMFTADGKMPQGGPENIVRILSMFNPSLKSANIDLSKTYTTEFVDKALQNMKQ